MRHQTCHIFARKKVCVIDPKKETSTELVRTKKLEKKTPTEEISCW